MFRNAKSRGGLAEVLYVNNDKFPIFKSIYGSFRGFTGTEFVIRNINMQFSGLNEIQSQLAAYIQAKLRVRLRFRVRVRLGLMLELGLGLGLGLTDRMHALARIGSKLTLNFV